MADRAAAETPFVTAVILPILFSPVTLLPFFFLSLHGRLVRRPPPVSRSRPELEKLDHVPRRVADGIELTYREILWLVEQHRGSFCL